MDVTEAGILYMNLNSRADELDQYTHLRHLHQYEKLCNAYNSIPEYPLCKIRLAKYFWGQYYFRCRNYLDAEIAYMEALHTAAPTETLKLLPDIKIKYGLLLVYQAENRTEDLLFLLRELTELMVDERYGWALDQEECLTIYTVCNEYYNSTWGHGYLGWLTSVILDLYQGLISGRLYKKGHNAALVRFTCTSALLLAETGRASSQEYKACWEILNYFHDIFLPDEGSRIIVLRTMIRIAPELHLHAKEYVDELVELVESRPELTSVSAEIFQMAASYYRGAGNYDEGRECLQRALEMITKEWHFAIRYFDKRAYQILGPAQLNFLGCYDTIRKYMDESYAYETVLQFKALASLAGRERNRILHSNKIDPQIMRNIKEFQNRIAWNEVEKIFRNPEAEYEYDESILRRLEADFTKEYPSNLPFVEITLEKVQEVLPNQSAVVEYLFYEIDYERHEFSTPSPKRETAIDIYVLCKRNHKCTLKRWSVSNGNNVLEQTQIFVSLLSETESISGNQKAQLRKALYQKLIAPFLSYVSGIKRLYIAPDRELLNLPFELLSDGRNIWLEESYDIVRIECGRDLLFSAANHKMASASLVIGNPQVKIGSMEDTLPFSELEAMIVSKYCECQYYSGAEAIKSLLLKGKRYRNIHIAAHGYFDNRRITEHMYASGLFFAGKEDWQQSGRIDPVYGNGIVTADEISRMNLQGVELVVLSACWSGMNIILEDKGFHGLLGAFSAAGAHYVISHLWSADDFSSTILMGYFYHYYRKEKQPPPAALNLAKHRLRNATISQLQEEGWFRFLLCNVTDSETEDTIRSCQACEPQERPFSDETYWGGFACYRCN